MSSLAANSEVRLLNKILYHLFGVKNIHRCFVIALGLRPPWWDAGYHYPALVYVPVTFWLRFGLNLTVGDKYLSFLSHSIELFCYNRSRNL